MQLCVTLVSVLLWGLLATVETRLAVDGRFFLEVVKPSVETTALMGKMIERGKRDGKKQEADSEGDVRGFAVHLYQCIPYIYEDGYFNECNQIRDASAKEGVYAIANFNGVSDLEIPENHFVSFDRHTFKEKLPQAITIGVDMLRYYSPVLKPTAARVSLHSMRVYEFLGRLVDFKNPSNVEVWREIFSINVVTYFHGHDTKGMHLFDHFVAVLQKLIDSSGYTNQLGQPQSGSSKKKAKTGPSSPKGLTRSKSQSNSWSLCQALGQRLFRSRSGSKQIPTRCWSKLRSSLVNPFSKSQSQSKSPSRFPPPASSPPRITFLSQFLTDADMLEIAGLLIFKVFDPCFIQSMKTTDLKVAEQHCKIHCQFVSATVFLSDQKVSDYCEHFEKGYCARKMCMCSHRQDIYKPDIPMVHCNSALRGHIYKQAQHLSLKGLAKQNL